MILKYTVRKFNDKYVDFFSLGIVNIKMDDALAYLPHFTVIADLG